MKTALAAILTGVMLLVSGCQAPPAQPETVSAGAVAIKPTAKASLHYLDNQALERLDVVLPAAPTDRGPISRGEGDLMLALQAEATPEAKARAKSEENLREWKFAEILGPGFNRAQMPLTGALLRNVEHDTDVATDRVKNRWARQRPPAQDDRLKAMFAVPNSASYPSGHAIRAMMWARVLALLAPEQEQELLQRGRLMAYDRVIAGVHYPTDVAAGMAFGNAIADELIKSPAFQEELAKARAEWPPKTR